VARPFASDSTSAILRATLDLVATRGYHETSLDEVVAVAESSKPTIYRRWRSKAQLVADAVRFALEAANPKPPDSADPVEDVRIVLRNLIRALTRTALGGAVRALVGVAESEPELSECLRAVEAERRGVLYAALAAASPHLTPRQVDLEVDRLLGTIYFRLLIRRVPITDRLADELLADR
jgi:AcrR family transcriptional regulator